MTDEWFRIVVAIGVGLAALAFVVQAIIVIAFYSGARKIQRKIEALTDRADPVIQKLGPLIDKAGPAVERAMPMLERGGSTLEKLAPLLEKSGPMMGSIDKAARQAETLLTTLNSVVEENRPRVAEVSSEVAGIARTGREQVEKLGDFLTDASERARNRLEQIDDTVSSTVEHVEEAGETVKNVVMRPVREVNGLAAGFSAVVSTLVRGRKSNVASATQDEEMFI
jgi:methyl-accepting chemotaxis protein